MNININGNFNVKEIKYNEVMYSHVSITGMNECTDVFLPIRLCGHVLRYCSPVHYVHGKHHQ